MQIIVLADESLRAELTSGGVDEKATIKWISKPEDFLQYPEAGAWIDLLFANHPGRIEVLRKFLPRTVIINSVEATLSKTDSSFVRINGWNSFLRSPLIEASAASDRRPAVE